MCSMDERAFIRELKEQFPFSFGTGIGDDASTVKTNDGHQLITTDLLVESVHFHLGEHTPAELAIKAVAVNLSDIAAMGGSPQYFYLNLAFPPSFTGKDLKLFFKGLEDACRRWGVELAGGDLSRSSTLTIAITMVGQAKRPVLRSGARTGDLIGITGPTGHSALGLQLLKRGVSARYWIKKHKQVVPRISEGKILSTHASAMIDVSDGLLIDLTRILQESGKGAKVFCEKLPLSSSFKKACRENNLDAITLALTGGEDYVLLYTLPPDQIEILRTKNFTVYIVGEVTEDRNSLLVLQNGRPLSQTSLGFDHFLIRTDT